MKRDGKLSVALHILAHLAEAGAQPTTSEALAAHSQTNPVVIRRSLAGLREAGIVTSVKGHGGGWTVARPAATISLREVYEVLGSRGELVPEPVAAPPGCLIDATISNALDGFYAEAEVLLLRRLGEITLADLAVNVQRRLTARTGAVHHTDVPSG